MWPALVFRRAPDRLGRGIGAEPAGVVEGEPQVIRQRRLARILALIEPPFAGDVGSATPAALGRGPHVQGRGGERHETHSDRARADVHGGRMIGAWESVVKT